MSDSANDFFRSTAFEKKYFLPFCASAKTNDSFFPQENLLVKEQQQQIYRHLHLNVKQSEMKKEDSSFIF